MDVLREYIIPFKGLKNGDYDYSFPVDGALFQAFESAEIKDGKAVADVAMTKGDTALQLRVTICGEVVVECDRCLEDCTLPVRFSGELEVRFSEQGEEFDGETMWLEPGERELDLAQYIYESVVLSLPYQRVHPAGPDGEPTCDPQMLSRFRIVTEQEFERIEEHAVERQMAEDAETIEEKLRGNGDFAKLQAVKESLEKETKD